MLSVCIIRLINVRVVFVCDTIVGIYIISNTIFGIRNNISIIGVTRTSIRFISINCINIIYAGIIVFVNVNIGTV